MKHIEFSLGGGVFHCRVHSCEYGLFLYKHSIVSDKFFYSRESAHALRNFIARHRQQSVQSWQDAASFVHNAYRVQAENGEYFEVTPEDIFLAYNGTALAPYVRNHPNLKGKIPMQLTAREVYHTLIKQIDPEFQAKYPHMHNFQYIDAQMIMDEMKNAGFSEIYRVEIGQSVAPPLWENCFHIVHSGFSFGVEAIK